jgi:hypothetical protein
MENSGYHADLFIKRMLGRGYDIIWDGTGAANTFAQPGASSSSLALPNPNRPKPLYLYW